MGQPCDISSLFRRAPLCPPPERIVHSHWMSHLPFAFWLVEILRPALLVELGAYQGASFCAFCQQIESLGLSCEAYAVDTWQGDDNMGAYGDEVYTDLSVHVQARYPGFAALVRSSFDDALPRFENGSIDLLHIDGYHGKDAMLHDFEQWLPKMSSRGVILMHDIRARLPGYGGVAAWREISSRFPSFAFSHGYGLGLVVTGQDSPAELVALTRMDTETAAGFQSCFQRQGRIYETLFGLGDRLRQEQAESRMKAKAAGEQAARDAAIRTELERILAEERAAHALEACRLRDAILQAELKAQAYEGSLSWKLTAPLRKLASYFRS